MAGGLLGKGVFAFCFVWILSGGYKNIGSGLNRLVGVHKQLSLTTLVWLLTGAGAALTANMSIAPKTLILCPG